MITLRINISVEDASRRDTHPSNLHMSQPVPLNVLQDGVREDYMLGYVYVATATVLVYDQGNVGRRLKERDRCSCFFNSIMPRHGGLSAR